MNQWRRLAWGTGARAPPQDFANARKFCRPNARWLSLLDDFVTTNFGTRAPRARAPWSKILATPLTWTECVLFPTAHHICSSISRPRMHLNAHYFDSEFANSTPRTRSCRFCGDSESAWKRSPMECLPRTYIQPWRQAQFLAQNTPETILWRPVSYAQARFSSLCRWIHRVSLREANCKEQKGRGKGRIMNTQTAFFFHTRKRTK